jgi:hypothetical protein
MPSENEKTSEALLKIIMIIPGWRHAISYRTHIKIKYQHLINELEEMLILVGAELEEQRRLEERGKIHCTCVSENLLNEILKDIDDLRKKADNIQNNW